MAFEKYPRGVLNMLTVIIMYPLRQDTRFILKILHFLWGCLFISAFVSTGIQCFIHVLTYKPFVLAEQTMSIMMGAVFCSHSLFFAVCNWQRKEWKKLVRHMNEYFVEETDNGMDYISMEESYNLSNKIPYFWATFLSVLDLPIALAALRHPDRSLTYTMWVPFDYKKTPAFQLICFWQGFNQVNLGLMYGTTDITYLSLCILMKKQFEILASNLKNNIYHALLECGVDRKVVLEFSENFNHSNRENSDRVNPVTHEIIRAIESDRFKTFNMKYLQKNVKHHEQLFEVCRDLDAVMNPFLMVKLGGVFFNGIFAAFNFIKFGAGDLGLMLTLLCWLLSTFLELFLFCYGGQMLFESANFTWDLYESPWYACDLTFQKVFLFLHMRTSKLLRPTAGYFFTLSSISFVGFARTIFSYTAVLREVESK